MKKRILAMGLAVALLAGIIPAAFAIDPIGYAVVHNPDPSDRLNLREKASVASASLGKYYNGTNVTILCCSGSEWAYVSIGFENGDIMGYMQTKYLDSSADRDAIPSAQPVYTHGGSLTLYEKQSLKGESHSFSEATVTILGFTASAWHVQVSTAWGGSGSGFIKPGDKSLVESQSGGGSSSSTDAVVNNPNPKDRLNLREAPSVSSKSLGKYYNGTRLTIDKKVNATWAQVTVGTGAGKLSGYMQLSYLATGTDRFKVKNATPMYLSTMSAWRAYTSQSLQGTFEGFGYLTEFRLLGFTNRVWHIEITNSQFLDATFFVPAKEGFTLFQWALVNNPNPADRLNVRVSASSNAATLGRFYNGTLVYVMEENVAGKTWVKVMLINAGGEFRVSGYMEKKYLAFDSAMDKVKTAFPVKTLASSNGAEIPVKAFGNGVQDTVLIRLPSGTKVNLLGVHDDYVFIEYKNVIGVVKPGEIK